MTGLDIAKMRPVIESEIDRLIAILDMLEPDPDFEDGADLEEDTADDEPLVGAPNQSAGSWKGIDASFGCDDGEELELGWTELEARWNRYAGCGADVYEPSLGSTHSINQNSWSKGGTDDLEEQCDDEGHVEEDAMYSDDEVIGWHSFSRSERVGINAASASLSEIVERRELRGRP